MTPNNPERRNQPRTREIFVQACEMLAPLVAGNDLGLTVSSFAMTQMLLQQFPDLTRAEARIIIVTVEKVHREDRMQKILNTKS